MPERLRIVVLGMAGGVPFAGVGWQTAHYLEGLRRLGHDVHYVEDTGRWPYDPVDNAISDDPSRAIAYVAALMARCELEERWAYRDVVHERVHGLTDTALRRVLSEADLLINLSGATVLRDEHLRAPVRVYLETDPVRPQIEVAQGRAFTIELLAAHTHHFSYGENLSAPDCPIPLGGFDYLPTRQPVVLDWWDGAAPAPRADWAFTTVGNWRQTEKDVEWDGEVYTWSKDAEFLRFLDLPRHVTRPLELALASADEDTIRRLRAHGWRVRDGLRTSADLDGYRAYIRESAGEFSVAKDQNVRLRTGWFSDRTACYLAAGRPAVVQDTAFDRVLPVGEGLFAFDSLEEAREAFAAIESDYPRHARAARTIAEEHFDATTVLEALLERAGGSAG